jgi:4-hydroxy-tetrahydrodipicolinate synthase
MLFTTYKQTLKKEDKMKNFAGLGTALVTPFNKNGEVDWETLERLVVAQVNNSVDFLVPCGTTGESPTLNFDEHKKIIAVVVAAAKRANGGAKILAGTGANSTAEAVDLTKEAKKVGADGVLVVSPYYNKPMPAGFLDYYRQIAKVGLPVVLYDIPGRTAKGVPTDIILQLAKEGSIVGLKWASGDINQLMDVIKHAPDNFTVLSGDDNLTFPLMALGGDGVISVLSNLMPARLSAFVKMALNGEWEAAREEHYRLLDLMRAMFIETNPIPVKTAMTLVGMLPTAAFRSPMSEMATANLDKLKAVLKKYLLLE